MLQHSFYNCIRTFAMMIYFFFILFNIICNRNRFFYDFRLSISVFNSPINSLFTSEKLFTKFNGFCISCAMPAVSSPSEAIFSDWMSWAWVDFNSDKVLSTFSFCCCNKTFAFCFCLLFRHCINAITITANTTTPSTAIAKYCKFLFALLRHLFFPVLFLQLLPFYQNHTAFSPA